MSLTFHWFLPTSGDGRSIVGRGHSMPNGPDGRPAPNAATDAAATAIRPPDIGYLAQAYWFGEGVRPELRRRGLLAPTAPYPQTVRA